MFSIRRSEREEKRKQALILKPMRNDKCLKWNLDDLRDALMDDHIALKCDYSHLRQAIRTNGGWKEEIVVDTQLKYISFCTKWNRWNRFVSEWNAEVRNIYGAAMQSSIVLLINCFFIPSNFLFIATFHVLGICSIPWIFIISTIDFGGSKFVHSFTAQ